MLPNAYFKMEWIALQREDARQLVASLETREACEFIASLLIDIA